MNYETIIYNLTENIATICINRPEAKNSLSDHVRSEIKQALEEAKSDTKVKGIILTGGEEVFAAGADIKAMASLKASDMFFKNMNMTREVVEMMEDLPKPVIGALAGYVLGGGCELTLGCDYRIASENATFGFPEIKLGIFPGGGGTQRLSRLVGISRAKDLIFSGKIFSANEALSYGLIDEFVPEGKVLESAKAKMKSYIRHSAIALSMAKYAINHGWKGDFSTGNKLESMCFSLLFSTEDQKEGMNAFMEKRKPHFTGQ